ncbi:MAG: winged helix-turn-helix domain-containing protein [Planctomycetota bacterium]|jgi:molybdate transport system regulatory protein
MGRKKTKTAEARCRIWVVKGKDTLFGDGRARILEAVRKHGSLNKAAQSLNMSYRAVWGKIKKSENLLGAKLVEPAAVKGHRGSRLTKTAEEIIKAYNRFKTRCVKNVDSCFQQTIGKILN